MNHNFIKNLSIIFAKNIIFITGSLILFIIFFFSDAYSGIILDYQGLPYFDIIQDLSNSGITNIDAVIISAPFKGYDGSLKTEDDDVYDFNDLGNKFQRGSYSTFYGDFSSFQAVSKYLKTRKISLYSRVNLFKQKAGYNKNEWNIEDFTPDSLSYSGQYIVDIKNLQTYKKIEEIIKNIRDLPVERWVIDLRDLPDNIREDYSQFVRDHFGISALLFSGSTNSDISSDIYWELRERAFMMPVPDFYYLDQIAIDKNEIYYIESGGTSVNNCSAFVFLYAGGAKLAVPYNFFNNFNADLMDFLADFSLDKKILISKEKMIWYNGKKVIAFNFSDTFSIFKFDNIYEISGTFKSKEGSSILNINGRNIKIFMFPESFSFWDLSAK